MLTHIYISGLECGGLQWSAALHEHQYSFAVEKMFQLTALLEYIYTI